MSQESIIRFNLAPPPGKDWTRENIELYLLQVIARSVHGIAERVDALARAADFGERKSAELRVAEGALELQHYQAEIRAVFAAHGQDTMRASTFYDALCRLKLYLSAKELRGSIIRTDFLTLEPVGGGHRVRLIAAEPAALVAGEGAVTTEEAATA